MGEMLHGTSVSILNGLTNLLLSSTHIGLNQIALTNTSRLVVSKRGTNLARLKAEVIDPKKSRLVSVSMIANL